MKNADEKATVELHGWTLAMVPMAVVFDGSLPAGACRLAAYLVWRQGTNPDSWPGVPRMARELEVSERTIRRWRAALFAGGHISVTPRPGSSNLYRVHAEPTEAREEEEIPLAADAKAMTNAVMDACCFLPDTATQRQWGRAGKTAQVLRAAGRLPGDIVAFVDWWYDRDWRGKQGDPPTPEQMRSEWGTFEAQDQSTREAAGRVYA
jgi:hypothetical protein